jgi:type IV secretion system protein VirB8
MLAIFDKAKAGSTNASVTPTERGQGKQPVNMDQLGDWYMKQALDFEKSKTEENRASKKTAWRVATGSMILAGVAIVTAGANMFINKPNPPAVWSHNAVTGEVTQLTTLKDGTISFGKATDLYYLRQYIHFRESYDWEVIQSYYDATRLLSSEKEADLYKKISDPANTKAPVNVLKDNYRVIATAGTISFVGETALVSFSKKIVPLNGGPNDKPHTEYFQATVTFEYENAPMTETERGINVPGFKVTSYTVERDITKSEAVTTEAAVGANP